MMHESTLDLFCEYADEIMADEYAKEIELKAAELEVTVDYYMSEFMWYAWLGISGKNR